MSDDEFSIAGSGSGRSSSSSGGSKSVSSSEESNVFVKGEHGTTLFRPDSDCEECGEDSKGVFVTVVDGMRKGTTLCDECHEVMEESAAVQGVETTFIEFEG